MSQKPAQSQAQGQMASAAWLLPLHLQRLCLQAGPQQCLTTVEAAAHMPTREWPVSHLIAVASYGAFKQVSVQAHEGRVLP